MNSNSLFRVLSGFLLLLSVSAANAVSIDALDRGWYAREISTGVVHHTSSNTNYLVGAAGWPTSAGPNGAVFRNFFVFDLSGFSDQTITSAVLHLYNPKVGDFGNSSPTVGGYYSSDATETYELREFGGPATTLLNGEGGLATFDDLADGLLFGSYVASLADNGAFIDIILNADAIAAIQASTGGLFAIAGRLPTIAGGTGAQTVFGYSNDPNMALTQLMISVPEPAAFGLFLFGLVAIGLVGRKKICSVSNYS